MTAGKMTSDVSTGQSAASVLVRHSGLARSVRLRHDVDPAVLVEEATARPHRALRCWRADDLAIDVATHADGARAACGWRPAAVAGPRHAASRLRSCSRPTPKDAGRSARGSPRPARQARRTSRPASRPPPASPSRPSCPPAGDATSACPAAAGGRAHDPDGRRRGSAAAVVGGQASACRASTTRSTWRTATSIPATCSVRPTAASWSSTGSTSAMRRATPTWPACGRCCLPPTTASRCWPATCCAMPTPQNGAGWEPCCSGTRCGCGARTSAPRRDCNAITLAHARAVVTDARLLARSLGAWPR